MVGRWWHSNWNKTWLSLAVALPTAGYLVYSQFAHGQPAILLLSGKLLEYLSFIALLGSLYTVTGGIVISGDPQPAPSANTAILGLGACLANLVGTTGASMLLIRPFLQINRARRRRRHLPIFFIFVVGNTGGLLTPLGDPPLFLGFLNGVPFAWPLRLWPQWVVANGVLLGVFYLWDRRASSKEEFPKCRLGREPIRVRGAINLVFLGGIVCVALLQGSLRSEGLRHIVPPLLMLCIAAAAFKCGSRELRAENEFNWRPIIEVAVLFAGIFVTLAPALVVLKGSSDGLGLSQPWHYFWATGILSAVLDNAPTYLTFATLAAGPHPINWLVANRPEILAAITCGSVFMGAFTYIGNGPNLMVRALADEYDYKMPSFLGYLPYSLLVLGPIFLFVTLIFFSGIT